MHQSKIAIKADNCRHGRLFSNLERGEVETVRPYRQSWNGGTYL
jgi:hypothetical protein